MPEANNISSDVSLKSGEQTPIPRSPSYNKKRISSKTNGSSRTRKSLNISEKSITESITTRSVHQRALTLKVNDREELRSQLALNRDKFSNLTTIDMSWTDIKIGDLKNLLEATPRLKRLDIWHCEDISAGDLSKLPPTLFNSLQNIEISFTLISNKDIQTLLPATPKLKDINLWYCKNLKQGAFSTLTRNSLPFLTIARLGALQLKVSDIQDLLKAAPNLTQIHLRNCPYLNNIEKLLPEHINVVW